MRGCTQSDDGSSLCVSCGLCCGGLLFERAKAYPVELDALAANGMAVTDEDRGKTYFRLPCRHLRDTACSIYEGRFTTCRKYSCKLLDDVKAGLVGGQEARQRVGEAKALAARVAERAPELLMAESRYRFLRLGPGKSAPDAFNFVTAIALDRFLDRYFRKNAHIHERERDPEA